MNRVLRRWFTVRYVYPDPLQALRARMLLPFSLTAGLVLIVINVMTLLDVVNQRVERIQTQALILLPIAWGICLTTAYLVQHGRLNLGIGLVGAILVVYNLTDVLLSGTMTTGIIFPMVIVFFSLSFGARGAAGAYLFAVPTLIAMYFIRSNQWLGTEKINNLSSIVFFSSMNLTVTTIMLWLFGGHLQQTFRQSARIVTQTRTTAAVGQSLSHFMSLGELLPQAVDLIQERFALYHVQIFMVDESRSYANLVASTGESGKALLAQGFRVPVGVRSVAGQAIESADSCYVEDITQTAYQHPAQLPDTRTELALPLLTGDDVVGVLDIHSARPYAFTLDDIETLRILANQLSQTIHNARLFETQQQNLLQNRRLFLESETHLREIERLNRQLTGQSWQQYIAEHDPALFGIQMSGSDVVPGLVEWTPAMRQAAERRRMVSQKQGEEQVLAVPIQIRGEAIGAVEVRLADQPNQTEIRSIVQAVAERMAVSLENIRLFERAQMSAEREQQINHITAQLQGLTSVEDVLATALETLGQALGADQGAIRLLTRDAAASDDNKGTPA
jgi:GAF domain-containing protein